MKFSPEQQHLLESGIRRKKTARYKVRNNKISSNSHTREIYESEAHILAIGENSFFAKQNWDEYHAMTLKTIEFCVLQMKTKQIKSPAHLNKSTLAK